MIEPTTLLTYVLVVLGFVFIPGPATLLTVARATSSGTQAGLATGFGIATGDLVHTAMAVVGLSAIIAASATLFTALKYLGVAYLIFLGIRAILARAPVHAGDERIAISPELAFRQAMIAEMLNPKTALFFLAFLPQFVSPETGSIALQLTVLGVVFVLLGLVSTVVFAVTAGGVGRFLRQHPVVVRWQGKVVGGIYCALGLRLALQER